MMRETISVALLLCALAAAVQASGAGGSKSEKKMVASDGVRYGDVRCRRVMQKEALSKNLLPNGSFEKGRYWPAGWEPIDRLGTFWTKGGTDGDKCMRIFTNVLDTQWVRWNKKVRETIENVAKRNGGDPQSASSNPLPQPPKRKETSPPYYDTVAGLHGIHYRSRRVKLKPGAIYRISIDARTEAGKAEPIVFVKSFFEFRGVMRNAGRAPLHLYDCGEKWKRYARVFHPAEWTSTVRGKPITPEKLEVQIYAYWPPGNYYFDNVQLHIVGHQEVPDRKEKAQHEKERKEREKKRQQMGEDEFPTFDP